MRLASLNVTCCSKNMSLSCILWKDIQYVLIETCKCWVAQHSTKPYSHRYGMSRCVSLLLRDSLHFYAFKLHLSGLKQAKVHIFDQPQWWKQQVIHIPLEKKIPRSPKIHTPWKCNIAIHSPWKWMLGRWVSFWDFPIFRGYQPYVKLRGGKHLVPCDHVTMTSKFNNFC